MLIFVLLTTIFTANDLKQQCASDVLVEQGFCLGYLKGFTDGVMFTTLFSRTAAVGPEAGVGLAQQDHERLMGCIPDEVNIEQMRLVFLKYVDNHPEELHLPLMLVLTKAI